MKRLMIILSMIASPAFADGPSTFSEPPVTKPVCAYQFLWLKWTGDCHAKRNVDDSTDRDGVSDPIHRPPSVGKPTERPDRDKPRHERDPAPSGKVKGNASANNGNGGNYEKTGHSDNGKGQGRNKDKSKRR